MLRLICSRCVDGGLCDNYQGSSQAALRQHQACSEKSWLVASSSKPSAVTMPAARPARDSHSRLQWRSGAATAFPSSGGQAAMDPMSTSASQAGSSSTHVWRLNLLEERDCSVMAT